MSFEKGSFVVVSQGNTGALRQESRTDAFNTLSCIAAAQASRWASLIKKEYPHRKIYVVEIKEVLE